MLEKIKIEKICKIAEEASRKIMKLYKNRLDVGYKDDDTPVTNADLIADKFICSELTKLTPEIPIISEEGEIAPYKKRKDWDYVWLIDPIDGTRDFIIATDDFVICIALIYKGEPVLGIIHHPVTNTSYYAKKGEGAFKRDSREKVQKLNLKPKKTHKEIVIIGSRIADNERMNKFIQDKQKKYKCPVRYLPRGSALKFCLMAEGKADYYPQFRRTMEWDTAAGQIILSELGKNIYDFNSHKPLKYNKASLENSAFCAS